MQEPQPPLDPEKVRNNWVYIIALLLPILGGWLNHVWEKPDKSGCEVMLMQMNEKLIRANDQHLDDLRDRIRKDEEKKQYLNDADSSKTIINKKVIPKAKALYESNKP